MRLFLMLLLVSCQSTHNMQSSMTRVCRTVAYQQEIDHLIMRDAENKRWARIYLEEIDAAMLNDDIPAYVFFVGEYEKIPRDIVPVHLRNEPGYTKPPSDLELFFRLRWFEQAVILYKQQTGQ